MLIYGDKSEKPLLHFTAPKNWMNDPNGVSFYDGNYHLFYQHNPKGLTWGNISWGHAVSKDMVHWTHLPIALLPDKNYDCDGVFSGNAIVFNNQHVLYYTGVKNDEKGMKQVQCMAISEDGITYKKSDKNPILKDDEHVEPYDFRDPYVWMHDDEFYMIVGTKESSVGKAVIYKSDDGITFRYFTDIKKENIGNMWECPSLFSVNGQGLFMFSAMNVGENNDEDITYISKAKMDYGIATCDISEPNKMDYGREFYAPQPFFDKKGRLIVIGWLRMAKPLDDNQDWTGMMSLPREIVYSNSKISYKIIDEVFYNKKSHLDRKMQCKEINRIPLDCNKVYEIVIIIDSESDFELSLSEKSKLKILYSHITKKVSVSRSLYEIEEVFTTPAFNKSEVKLQIILDRCIAEVFINDGAYVLSTLFQSKSDIANISISKPSLYFEYSELGEK